ncbi:MAG: elongation factor P [Candidatus Paceibacterota bacterium]
MISHIELKKGLIIVIEGSPYQIIESAPQRCAQRRLMIQTKLKNLINGNVLEKTVHQGETFEEADIIKLKAKFLYSHRDKFIFCEEKDPSKRFELSQEQIGDTAMYLKPNTLLEALIFQDKVINVLTPIKAQLKVKEAPPGIRGDRAQGGTKTVILETGAQINVPLFIETDDVVEINTETGEYVRRVE